VREFLLCGFRGLINGVDWNAHIALSAGVLAGQLNEPADEADHRPPSLFKGVVMSLKGFKFELGQTLKDTVTGLTGVVMVRAEYSTGCVHYGLLPRTLHEGKPVDWSWLDESRLILVDKKRIGVAPEKKVSGPYPKGPQL
jgi:hypothetical protein